MTAAWVFALVALLGCGSGSGGGGAPSAAQVKDACVKICQKELACNGDPSLTLDCNAFCADNSAGGGSGMIPPGCNTNDAINKVQACANGTCDAFQGCLDEVTSACPSTGTGGTTSTGTGGTTSTGTGGAISTGTGGTTGGGDCSICTKANACCVALFTQMSQDTSACDAYSAATCTSAAANQSVVISVCQSILTAAAGSNNAACK